MLNDTLKRMGFHSFRPGQEEIISSVLQSNDTFAMLPTGSGKTLCYHLPSKLLSGLVVIISPLISLMSDQVTQLRAQGERRVSLLTSLQSAAEKKEVLQQLHSLDMLFISPEMLSIPRIQRLLATHSVDLFVVDEAHCISQWGHEFRPEYQKLGNFITKLGNPPVLALTATATTEVERDIIHQLSMKNPSVFRNSVNRENIFLSVQRTETQDEKNNYLLEKAAAAPKPCIIYAGTRKETEETSEALKQYNAAFYHGGMSGEDRTLVQAQFLHDDIDILVATNAFGMGINKPNIRTVIHTHLPSSLEQYTQEIGRAGRDGKQSEAVLITAENDHLLPLSFINSEFPEKNWLFDKLYPEIKQEKAISEVQLKLEISEGMWKMLTSHLEEYHIVLENKLINRPDTLKVLQLLEEKYESRKIKKIHQLRLMEGYKYSSSCLRKKLLAYFGEAECTLLEEPCCNNCNSDFVLEQAPQRSKRNNMSWTSQLEEILFPEKVKKL